MNNTEQEHNMNSQQPKFTQAIQTSKKQLWRAIASAIGMAAAATATATPLPNGTILPLTPGSGSAFNVECATGTSCFGFEVTPDFYFWQDINLLTVRNPDTGEIISVTPTPGNDPGIIIGKDQRSGGQELAPSATNTTPGDITGAWIFGGNFGTFYTAPGLYFPSGTLTLGASANLFDDASCARATCVGKTELKVWNMAWNGGTLPLGSQYPCLHANCSDDQKAGYHIQSYTVTPSPVVGCSSNWNMRFDTVVPFGSINGFRFRMVLAGVGVQTMPDCSPPPFMVNPVSIKGVYGTTINWTPSITGGTPPMTCRIGTPPSNGIASVASNCASGSYIADIGFIGTDSFTYIATNLGDSLPATVTAAITQPDTDTACTTQYPVKQVTVMGKQGHLSAIVTGNIISVNPNGKEIKICPTTTATYKASTTTPHATVVCQVKSNPSRGQGNVKVNDHIKCTDKPVGNDKLQIKIKSGVKQRVGG